MGSDSAVIRQRLKNGNVNYRWMKAKIIREVTVLAGPQDPAAWELLPHVNVGYNHWRQRCRRRYCRRLVLRPLT